MFGFALLGSFRGGANLGELSECGLYGKGDWRQHVGLYLAFSSRSCVSDPGAVEAVNYNALPTSTTSVGNLHHYLVGQKNLLEMNHQP